MVDNFLASDDLNICVEALLHKRSKNAGAAPCMNSFFYSNT